ncbi:LON peptidase substrate-binding domain-containing protein [Variovorax terrae]|uniref:LON peptidase substrate-binding domain-containing protein n=1 Tax=Variovorax terrae TaxID=2923278 RepID=A0A9X1VYC0_9BURK|nr:LON peptidase substrate-binding domain-containing protein [Variovorax terrae]MCJ0764267.1 LON peptidase substrate-binding domain-containing protein [Variovorax terrae]
MRPNPLTLSSLPLFPLGTVLFPGGLLPLRIFEVRYLDMIGKCHKAGAPFGVVTLKKGAEVRLPGAGAESFSAVGTLATITALETPQPGLMMIRCSGAQRFRIAASEQLRHGLWVAEVERIEDDRHVPIPADLQGAADALRKLIESLQARQQPEDQMPLAGPYRLDDSGWVANRWCELLPLPAELKQRLMELENPLVRLELVNDVLGRTGIAGAG